MPAILPVASALLPGRPLFAGAPAPACPGRFLLCASVGGIGRVLSRVAIGFQGMGGATLAQDTAEKDETRELQDSCLPV